jgi:hypothetical protein
MVRRKRKYRWKKRLKHFSHLKFLADMEDAMLYGGFDLEKTPMLTMLQNIGAKRRHSSVWTSGEPDKTHGESPSVTKTAYSSTRRSREQSSIAPTDCHGPVGTTRFEGEAGTTNPASFIHPII